MGTQRQGNVALDEFVIAGATAANLLSDSTGIDAISNTGIAALRILRINGAGNGLEWVAPTGGGAASLGDLSDVDGTVDTGTGKIMIGDGVGLFKSKAITGDITLSAAGLVGIAAGVVGTTELATDAVSSAKIIDGAVTNAKLDSLSVDSDNFGLAVAQAFTFVSTPSVGAEAANQIEFDYAPRNIAGTDLGFNGLIVEARVTDADNDNEPSSTAFFVEAVAGTMIGGIGSGTAVVRQDPASPFHIKMKVQEAGAATRYVHLRQAFGSKAYFRHLSGSDSAVFV